MDYDIGNAAIRQGSALAQEREAYEAFREQWFERIGPDALLDALDYRDGPMLRDLAYLVIWAADGDNISAQAAKLLSAACRKAWEMRHE